MRKIQTYVDRFLEWALVGLMAANVLNVLWQVFTRFILEAPSSFTEELARYLLIWVGLLGAAYGVGKKMHLAIDLLTARLAGLPQIVLELFIAVCIFAFAAFVMVVGGINLVDVTLSLEQISAALRIKVGYVYVVLPLSGILMMFYTFLMIGESVSQLKVARFAPSEKGI